MNDILFGNNNSKVITKLSKRYFKKNKVRNLAARWQLSLLLSYLPLSLP